MALEEKTYLHSLIINFDHDGNLVLVQTAYREAIVKDGVVAHAKDSAFVQFHGADLVVELTVAAAQICTAIKMATAVRDARLAAEAAVREAEALAEAKKAKAANAAANRRIQVGKDNSPDEAPDAPTN